MSQTLWSFMDCCIWSRTLSSAIKHPQNASRSIIFQPTAHRSEMILLFFFAWCVTDSLWKRNSESESLKNVGDFCISKLQKAPHRCAKSSATQHLKRTTDKGKNGDLIQKDVNPLIIRYNPKLQELPGFTFQQAPRCVVQICELRQTVLLNNFHLSLTISQKIWWHDASELLEWGCSFSCTGLNSPF